VDGEIAMKKVKTISQLKKAFKNKRVGLVTGVFDVLHFEHIEFLSFAKRKSDFLAIGLESDENVRLFKGKNRPIFNFKERASVLSALECVDFIFKIPKIKGEMASFYGKILKEVNPGALFSAVFADTSWKKKKKKAEELGIKFIPYDKKPKVSSSKVVSVLLK
jgi:cytidyltransferase-like protein